MGILCPVILPATCVVPPRNTKFAQHRTVGSELVGHDGGWSDALVANRVGMKRLLLPLWLVGAVLYSTPLLINKIGLVMMTTQNSLPRT